MVLCSLSGIGFVLGEVLCSTATFPGKLDGERWEHFLESRAGTFSTGFIIVGPTGWMVCINTYFIEVVSILGTIMYMYRTTLSIRLHRISIPNFDDDRAKLKLLDSRRRG